VVGHPPLRRAVAELCENAAEHGGSPVRVRVVEDDGGVTVEVRDDGDGLSDLEREVIEQGTETPLKHSLGVGLWLVNWIVTGVGGTVETAVDDGTVVTLSLTAAAEAEGCIPARYRRAALNTASDDAG
jgi:anti-sigma regulatory factor (Ser/Thr protein kinase)